MDLAFLSCDRRPGDIVMYCKHIDFMISFQTRNHIGLLESLSGGDFTEHAVVVFAAIVA